MPLCFLPFGVGIDLTKGFGAVAATCFTPGLAGIYFEVALKRARADLWVRTVQLSSFSLVPACLFPTAETLEVLRDLFWWIGFWKSPFGGLL